MIGDPAELGAVTWTVLAVAAFLIGVSKTAVPGLGTVSVALAAAVLPARASTAAILLLFIVGDVFALLLYRRHADWATLIRLLPAVLVGLALGAVFLAVADDGWVRRGIGVILIVLMLITLWHRSRRSPVAASPGRQRLQRIGYGSLSGFTTMVANAGGAAMSLYLLTARFPVRAFLGTAAWFFAILNLTKVPISVGLGLLTTQTLWLDLMLAPAVALGAFVGWRVVRRLSQRVFERLVIAFTLAGAVYLLV